MPRPSLDDLPDLCFLEVFKNLSILELLRTIRLVNTRWSGLTSTELNRRRSLVIVDKRLFKLIDLRLDHYHSQLIEHVRRDDGLTPWARLPQIDSLNMVNWNDDENCEPYHNQVHAQPKMNTTLMDSLPRISSLTVVQEFFDAFALEQVNRMIDHWRDDLVTLKLSLTTQVRLDLNVLHTLPADYDAQIKTQLVKLFDSINRAASLKHLTLDLNLYGQYQITNLPPLTILSQLKSFHAKDIFRNELENTFLRNYSANEQLQIATCHYFYFDVLLRIDPELCLKFIEIAVDEVFEVGRGDEEDDLNQMLRDMDSFCTRFTSLTHLSLKIGNISLTKLSRSLSRLTQLVHLSLCVYDELEFEDPNPNEDIVPVQSVRLITLELRTKSHKSTERLHLPEIFPNLQVLSIDDYNWHCTVCDVIDDGSFILDESDEQAPEMRQCAQLARLPFRRCPNLHTIEVEATDSPFLSVGLSRKLITRDEL